MQFAHERWGQCRACLGMWQSKASVSMSAATGTKIGKQANMCYLVVSSSNSEAYGYLHEHAVKKKFEKRKFARP